MVISPSPVYHTVLYTQLKPGQCGAQTRHCHHCTSLLFSLSKSLMSLSDTRSHECFLKVVWPEGVPPGAECTAHGNDPASFGIKWASAWADSVKEPTSGKDRLSTAAHKIFIISSIKTFWYRTRFVRSLQPDSGRTVTRHAWWSPLDTAHLLYRIPGD